jgi:hypothetical protein
MVGIAVEVTVASIDASTITSINAAVVQRRDDIKSEPGGNAGRDGAPVLVDTKVLLEKEENDRQRRPAPTLPKP